MYIKHKTGKNRFVYTSEDGQSVIDESDIDFDNDQITDFEASALAVEKEDRENNDSLIEQMDKEERKAIRALTSIVEALAEGSSDQVIQAELVHLKKVIGDVNALRDQLT